MLCFTLLSIIALSQGDDFVQRLCPWIPQDDDDRIANILSILRECYSDRKAYPIAVSEIQGKRFKIVLLYTLD